MPTESEWEYAARAETTTPFSTGNCIHTDQANYDGSRNWDAHDCEKTNNYRKKTLTVGQFAPNQFKLYDMNGNVWEWLQDCYHDSYVGAPTTGAAWEKDCKKNNDGATHRLLRGGSWVNSPVGLRSANRIRYEPKLRNFDIGFRLAKTL